MTAMALCLGAGSFTSTYGAARLLGLDGIKAASNEVRNAAENFTVNMNKAKGTYEDTMLDLKKEIHEMSRGTHTTFEMVGKASEAVQQTMYLASALIILIIVRLFVLPFLQTSAEACGTFLKTNHLGKKKRYRRVD